jgi:flagellar M-ring protein FliF
MLEGIVGSGNAIVRVNAKVDFNKVTLNEEEYDPSASVVRSKRNIEESSQTGNRNANTGETIVNQQAGVMPSSNSSLNGKMKKDTLTNYEINKVTRAIYKPAGTVERLSVAAVINGTYEIGEADDGTTTRTYVPRTEDEIRTFETIVKNAMGYNEDREDQVSVSSIPFSNTVPIMPLEENTETPFDIYQVIKDAKKPLINLGLLLLVFFVLIRPLMKNLNKMTSENVFKQDQLLSTAEAPSRIASAVAQNPRDKVLELSKQHPEKTEQLIKGWIGE